MTCQPGPSETTASQGERLVDLVSNARRHLACGDEAGLAAYLRRAWSVGELSQLLQNHDSRVAVVASRCLGVIGGPTAVIPLARALHHDDQIVVAAAEDALWRVWFNEAGVSGRRQLRRAADLMGEGRHQAACHVLDDVIRNHPNFAEAYNQRAIARFLLEDYIGSIADCKRVARLNRTHFGALAGMGHAHSQLGQYHEALACYQSALAIHPRMEGVRQSMRRIHDATHRHRPVA